MCSRLIFRRVPDRPHPQLINARFLTAAQSPVRVYCRDKIKVVPVSLIINCGVNLSYEIIGPVVNDASYCIKSTINLFVQAQTHFISNQLKFPVLFIGNSGDRPAGTILRGLFSRFLRISPFYGLFCVGAEFFTGLSVSTLTTASLSFFPKFIIQFLNVILSPVLNSVPILTIRGILSRVYSVLRS